MATWGFLTNHAHVLIQIARNPRSTVREIALTTGITERAAISILHDLRRAGIARSWRDGRQNYNEVDLKALARYRPWGASDMAIPEALMQATLQALSQLAAPGKRPPTARPNSNGPAAGDSGRRWGFLTTHALILIYVIQHLRSTVREIALAAGITERAAHSSLQDLREAGIIDRQREGRRNSYTVNFQNLEAFRREGTAPGLVPDPFVAPLVRAMLALHPAV